MSGGETPQRETWSKAVDFLLACVGFSVGLGNVWRFPYLCYKNGGGAFLIPYFICVIVGGIPLFFLEVAVGHFTQQGGVYAWKFCPLLQGIGWATTVTIFFVNCYYNIILMWAFYYMFASFTTVLPWETCDNYWNTDRCSTFQQEKNASLLVLSTVRKIDATTEFWENKVLNISSGVSDIGNIKWDLALTLVLAWVVVYMCIAQGIKTSGKVMYFTATSPYVFMIILLIRMSFLPGAKEGIMFYLIPDFTKVIQMQVWVDAGTQVFFSYAIALGCLTALGSFNKWGHNSYRDSIIFACVNSGTSLLAGLVIFMVLGFMAQEQGVSIDTVAESGPGLAFIAYPKAVSQMPIAPLWSAVFFFMIILLGLDSQFVGVEGFVTAFVDTFPSLRQGKYKREIFVLVVCIIKFAIGLSMVTNGGMYVFQLFDYYLGSRIILLVAFFMCVAVAWLYGVNRFYNNIEMMIGFRINPYMKIGWKFMSPAFCLAIFIMSGVNYSELTYSRPTGTYVYPSWAIGIGWILASISAACIPVMAVYQFIKFVCIERRPIISLIEPQDLQPHQLCMKDKKSQYGEDLEGAHGYDKSPYREDLEGAYAYDNKATAF